MRLIYNNQSTARIIETSLAGSPTVSKTIIIVTKPALGIPAAPTDAAVAVMLWIVIFSRTMKIVVRYFFHNLASQQLVFQTKDRRSSIVL